MAAWTAVGAAGAEAAGPSQDGLEGGSGKRAGILSLFNDNDMFARTDRRYTNGVKMGWTWLRPYRAGSADQRRWVSISLQQLMNTPEDVRRPGSPEGEQPYAGYLGLGLAFHTGGPRTLDTVALDLGTIGPASLAGVTQERFHRLFGFKPIRSWDLQLGNELVLGVSLDHREKIWIPASGRGLRTDAGFRSGASLGNAFTAGWAGSEIRAGWNLPGGFAPVAEPFGAGRSGPPDEALGARWSAYAYFAAAAQIVLRDAFLDGNLFGEGTSLDRYPCRARIESGFAVRKGRLGLSFAYVAHSRRYATERRGHVYGKAGLSYHF